MLARKDYLKVAKQKRPSRSQKQKAVKKQLQYIKRNLSHIAKLVELGASLGSLNKKQYKMLLVVTELYRQQSWLAICDKLRKSANCQGGRQKKVK